MDYAKIKKDIKEELLRFLDYSRELTDEEVEEQLDELLLKEKSLQTMPIENRQKLHKEIFYSIRKLDVLQELVDDTSITEIMINGTESIFI